MCERKCKAQKSISFIHRSLNSGSSMILETGLLTWGNPINIFSSCHILFCAYVSLEATFYIGSASLSQKLAFRTSPQVYLFPQVALSQWPCGGVAVGELIYIGNGVTEVGRHPFPSPLHRPQLRRELGTPIPRGRGVNRVTVLNPMTFGVSSECFNHSVIVCSPI